MAKNSKAITVQQVSSLIFNLREQKVILDSDLARLYSVATKALNRAVKRNVERFPEEFMFQLTNDEMNNLRSHFATSSSHGGRRYLPYAFTEHGAIMATRRKLFSTIHENRVTRHSSIKVKEKAARYLVNRKKTVH